MELEIKLILVVEAVFLIIVSLSSNKEQLLDFKLLAFGNQPVSFARS